MTTVEVSDDTHRELKDMKYMAGGILGREVTYDEIIRALLDFRDDAMEKIAEEKK